MPNPTSTQPQRGWSFWCKPALFVLVACVGLYYVKWSPYYLKAFVAADNHSIGASILNDQHSAPWAAALAYAQVYFLAIWKAALLAVILGSLLQVLIPRDRLLRLFGKAGLGSTLRGGLFALPGMMCSRCAAPVAAGMRRQQVSVGAALAFWIANPVLNPATLVFMGFVLGWGFTALRLVAGIVLVVGVSLVAQRIAHGGTSAASGTGRRGRSQRDRVAAVPGPLAADPVAAVLEHHPGVHPGGIDLGAARVWLFPHVDGAMADSLVWLVPLAIVGTLFVIPTAAEIPIVQTMMTLGMGTGPAVALRRRLPSVSLPSLLMLAQGFRYTGCWRVTVAWVDHADGVVCGLIGLHLSSEPARSCANLATTRALLACELDTCVPLLSRWKAYIGS